MSFYGKWETWKVTYIPKELNAGRVGVAFVEACDPGHAVSVFREQYAGEFHTVDYVEKLFG